MDIENKRILVTGGTGFIGSRLIEVLMLRHNVKNIKVLVRNFSHASRIARFDLEMIHGDITNNESVDNAMKDCDIVFHCAYDFSSSSKEREQNTRLGTENIAKIALKYNVKVVHISTVDVYGRIMDGILNEKTERKKSDDIYAKSKLIAEKIFMDYYHNSNLRVTIIQPTIVYGPFSRPWTITPVKQLRNNCLVLENNGIGCCNAIYIDDVIKALILASTNEKVNGETFLISGKNSITWREFYQTYEKILGINGIMLLSKNENINEIFNTVKKTNLQQLLVFIGDPYIRNELLKIPLFRCFFRILININCIKQILIKLVNSADCNNNQSSQPMRKEILIPDKNKNQLYNSTAKVEIGKARKLLGYEPDYDFENGIKLTTEYIFWSGI